MPDTSILPLTSSEIANLWNVYMADTLSVCVKKHLVAKARDGQIRSVLQQAQAISEQRLPIIAAIFRSNNVPIPVGYGDDDVDMEAPRLFSDTFALYHALSRSRWAMVVMSNALYLAARQDVRKIFEDGITDCIKLNKHATQVALEKGLLLRSPIVSIPPAPHFAEKPSYIGHIIGEQRPLHVLSVAHIFLSLLENMVGLALITGFSQVARDPEVKNFFVRGMEIGEKHINALRRLLSDENVPIPSSPDAMVTVSTIPPFSDKLMMGHITFVNSLSIADLGLGAGQSNRADVASDYLRLGAEVLQYGEDGINIFIRNGWMETPPQVVSHLELALSGKSK